MPLQIGKERSDVKAEGRVKSGQMLTNLISTVETGLTTKAPFIQAIRDPRLLIQGLYELQGVIGNDNVKDSIAMQIFHMIKVKRKMMKKKLRSLKDLNEESMLNTVLYGPPGVGKTLLCQKMAKLYHSLGYLDATGNTEGKKKIRTPTGIDYEDLNGELSLEWNLSRILILLLIISVLASILFGAYKFYKKYGKILTIFIGLAILVIFILILYIIGMKDASDDLKKGRERDLPPSLHRDDTPVKTADTDLEEPIKKKKTRDLNYDDLVKTVSREDFVGPYVGWTEEKTMKLLTDNIGKVLFVDEAYSLISSSEDQFGMIALTILNRFISENPEKIIIIFAGYKENLDTGVFTAQPGLRRRFMWHFDCEGYTVKELVEIFLTQMKKKGCKIEDEDALYTLFYENRDAFLNFGGDTEKLVNFTNIEHTRDSLDPRTKGSRHEDDVFTIEQVSRGIQILRENTVKNTEAGKKNPPLDRLIEKLFSDKNKTEEEEITELI